MIIGTGQIERTVFATAGYTDTVIPNTASLEEVTYIIISGPIDSVSPGIHCLINKGTGSIIFSTAIQILNFR